MPKQTTISTIVARKTFGICLSLSLLFSIVSPSLAVPAAKPGTTSSDKVMSDSTDDGSVAPALVVEPSKPVIVVKKTRAQRQAEEEAAAADAAKSAAIETNHALEHLNLAQHYQHRFNFKMAELELETTIMYAPEMKSAHRDYCLVSFLCGHPLRSLAEFMMVVGLGDPVPLTAEERTELTACGAKTHYRQGLKFAHDKNWKDATGEFDAALLYSPDNAAIVRSLAFCLASKGDFEAAEAQYNRSFSIDNSDPYTHADFAYILSEHGDNARAMDQLNDAIKIDPNVAALHIDMAWMAESKGELAKAETEFRQAIELSPKHAILWSHLGRVEERLGKASDAKTAYTEALALDPSQDDARKRLDELKRSDSNKEPSSPAVQPKSSS
jgi:tetratricopeptide (TPR) repeat protein